MKARELASEAATLALGAELAEWNLRSELVFLHGDLGAGKTTLVRGYLRSLGFRGAVKSPTYTLLESYELPTLRVFHFDFYRIIDPLELGYIGIDDLMAENAVKLVEWPAKAGDKLPPADIEIRLQLAATGRRASIRDAVASAFRRAAWLALAVAAPTWAANQLNGIRLHDAPDSTRVVLDTSEASSYKLFTMRRPHRVVIDLRETKPSFKVPEFESRVVERIRSSVRRKRDYRVVLDLRQEAQVKELVLKPIAPYGHRLVIDMFPASGGEVPSREPVRAPDALRKAVVAIDAGHGGEDPGAIGKGRVYEKKVVLAIARAIKKELDAMPGLRGTLVRSGDYYVPLRKRIAIARGEDVRADLFISIHADAFRLPSVHGASVFALSERGASSEMARWLAAAENRSDLIGGVSGSWVSLQHVDEPVAQVLVDLSMDHKMGASIELGEAVLGALGSVAKLHKNRVEQAGFAVLKAPDVPSILIETGFISNPDEARRLANPSYQRRIAGAIAEGIQGYLLRNPPPDTLLASLNETGVLRYVIKRGDTLSEIAVRNRVSMRSLRALNRLAGDRIRVGQVLLIPFGSGSG